jgi:serine/threonine-protein kinase RsbW
MVGGALRIELPARPENVALIREEVVSQASEFGMAPERLNDLKTIVSEACGNVVRYAYGDGEVGVVEVVLSAVGDQLEIAVRDGGRGISPRPDSVHPGLGLGLPLIGALSSRIRIDSQLGVGTEMQVSIPITAQ